MAYDELVQSGDDNVTFLGDVDMIAGAAPIRIAQAASSETFTKYGTAPNQ